MNKDIYKENGICVVCGKRMAEPNRVQCYKCLERDRKRKEELRKSGIDNREEVNKSHRKLYAKRKELGICTRCGMRKATNGTVCLDCFVKRKKQRKKATIERAEMPSYGMCYFCGGSILEGKRVCKKCYDRLLINTFKMNEVVRNARELAREQMS